MKLKRLVTLILVITMLVPVTYSTNTTKVSAASTFRIKGYRHSHAALIEWTKVPGATNYKIYRATRKKGKKAKYTKFKELKIKKGENKLTESWFTKYGDNILNTRWFVNVDTDGFEKTQKKYLYNHKKTYKYKVRAFDNNKKCIAISNTIKVKKYKSRMYEPRYENLYYVNKARYKYKLNVIPWGHQYNKATRERGKDLVYNEKNGVKFNKNSHYRPKKRGEANDIYKYLKVINVHTLTIGSPLYGTNEVIHRGSEYGAGAIKGYLNSKKGHKEYILSSTNKYATFNASLSERKNFYDVSSIYNFNDLVCSVNSGKKYNFPYVYKQILNNSVKETIVNGLPTGQMYQFDSISTIYPFMSSYLKNKYGTSIINKIFAKNEYYSVISKKNKVCYSVQNEQLLIDFLKDYVNVLPYK